MTDNKIPWQLIEELQNNLNRCVKNNSCKSFCDAAEILEKITKTFQKLDVNDEKWTDTALILRAIIFPFAVKIIDFNNENISQKMVSFLLWWINNKPAKAPDKQIIEILSEKRKFQIEHLKVRDILTKTKNKHPITLLLDNPVKSPTFDYILSLFEIKTFGQDCDDLISLILWFKDKENKIIFDSKIDEIWLLYFDPLCIENVLKINEVELNNVIGKIDLSKLGTSVKLPVLVHWSDSRSDEVSTRTYKRKRVDDLLHYLLETCKEDKCLELFKSIPHENLLKNIQSCSNEHLAMIKKDFLFKQYNILIKKIIGTDENSRISLKSKLLFNEILSYFNTYYKSLLNSSDYVTSIVKIIIDWPSLFKSDTFSLFFQIYSLLLNDTHLIENVNSLLQKLQITKMNLEELEKILQLTSMYFDEKSRRNFHSSITYSVEWLKVVIEQISESFACQEATEKIIKHFFCEMSSIAFLKLMNFYLESNNKIYIIYLSSCVTNTQLKVIRENFDEDDYLKLHETIIKLAHDTLNSNSKEYIHTAFQTLIGFLVSCGSIIRDSSNLVKKFAEKSFLELLLKTICRVEQISLKCSILNFLLNLIAEETHVNDKEKNEILETIINDAETFGILFNEENLILFLNYLQRNDEYLRMFFSNIIELVDSHEKNTHKCFSSFLECLNKLNDELKGMIFDKLREKVGFFIDLLLKKDFKKLSVKFLSLLLNFNDEEKRILNSYYGLSDTNRDKNEDKVDNKDFLFFITENLKKKKNESLKNDIDEVTQTDLNEVIKLLEDNIKAIEANKQIKTKNIPQIEENSLNSLNFVWTETTKSNLNKILQAEISPILLEGGTGIGKSATIQVAADITKNELIRFNMSSRVTIDDFLGKVSITKDVKTNKDTFEFQLSPFSVAFQEGHWLLLDEMNLAPDNVLQCIENSLDSKCLILNNPCDSTKPVNIINMHPNFRLFATQNPSVGFFKGKREKLSQSLLDRFTIYYFDELPIEEWIQIAKKKLSKNFQSNEADTLAEKLVKSIHMNIKQKISEKGFQEKSAYAEITIRDLFKLCERLIFLKHNQYYSNTNANKVLSFCAFLIYGARFRESGRLVISDILKNNGFSTPSLDVEKYEINRNKVVLDEIILKNYRDSNSQFMKDISKYDHRYAYLSRIQSLHDKIEAECLTKDFITKHGLYVIDDSLISNWFNRIENEKKDEWNQIGFNIYAGLFRHQEIRDKVLELFKTEFKCNFDLTQVNKNKQFATRPFVITKRVLKVWKQIGWNLDSSYPILLSGIEGCGKSETIYAFAKLTGMDITQVCLTPETEASHLVGQYNPNDGSSSGEKIVWQDGFVTKAFKKGSSILLDNLNQGDSCVLERLNPLLENEPIWVLTENRETKPIEKKENFKVFATMTVNNSNSGNKNLYPELSPALYNRFSIVHMENNDLIMKKNLLKTKLNQ